MCSSRCQHHQLSSEKDTDNFTVGVNGFWQIIFPKKSLALEICVKERHLGAIFVSVQSSECSIITLTYQQIRKAGGALDVRVCMRVADDSQFPVKDLSKSGDVVSFLVLLGAQTTGGSGVVTFPS